MPFSSTLLSLANLSANCNKLRLLFLQQQFYYSTASSVAGHASRRHQQQQPVNFDVLGTWDSRVELPLELEASITYGRPIPKILVSTVGAHSARGKRPYNEDRYVAKELAPSLLYFAVFDGHGGSECSDYCYSHMEEHLTYWLERDGTSDLQHAVDSAFLELNNAFGRWWAFHGKATNSAPGSTATITLLHNNIDLYVGHVGDSRAMLCRNGKPLRLTTDHCPTLLAEKTRIEQSQGKVVVDDVGRSMVNGRLAMTRSIGDLELKRYGVSAVPDVRKLSIKHGKDAFLVLTTDGINCVMSDQEICDVITRTEEPSEAAQALTDQALHYSSEDNATAVVVPLGSWGTNTTSASIFYSFGRSMTDSSRFS